MLGGHYRSQLQFSYTALDGARNARKVLGDRVRALADKAGAPAKNVEGKAKIYLDAFNAALEDDLSTPRALAELWGLARDSEAEAGEALAALLDMDRVLGLRLEQEMVRQEKAVEDLALVAEITGLIAERLAAKKAKNFARADEIRRGLKERGIILEDKPDQTVWRVL